MTGNVTNLATSRRLAKVWPRPDDKKGWAWVGAGDETRLMADCHGTDVHRNCEILPARTLSELEAKIREMGLEFNAFTLERVHGKKAIAYLFPKSKGTRCAEAKADHIIDALGAAVAEALERAGEGGKKV